MNKTQKALWAIYDVLYYAPDFSIDRGRLDVVYKELSKLSAPKKKAAKKKRK